MQQNEIDYLSYPLLDKNGWALPWLVDSMS